MNQIPAFTSRNLLQDSNKMERFVTRDLCLIMTWQKSQIATSKIGSGGKQKLPLNFIKNGVAMLSAYLKQQISFLVMESSLKEEVGELKSGTNPFFKVIFERLDNLEDQITSNLPSNRKNIDLKK